MATLQTVCIFVLLIGDFLDADMLSVIDFHSEGTGFIPVNPRQLISTISSAGSKETCAYLCHQNPSCRTFVSDTSTCQLYEGTITTGQVVPAVSTMSLVGGISYDNIDLSSSFNRSCDHCYPDRYLVCQAGRCQCPSGTFWNGKGQCINEQFVGSTVSCEKDIWCRQDMNLSCVCGKCQCPLRTFWKNDSCVPQFLQGVSCNSSDQCRTDLQLVCSRINKTCSALSPVLINIINATIPDIFQNIDIELFYPGSEWWCLFDNRTHTVWNAMGVGPNAMYVTLNDEYLLTSMRVTAYGDMWHDPKVIELYVDEDATCLSANFTYPQPPSYYYAHAVNSLITLPRPLIVRRLLINIAQRLSMWQAWLPEIALYGIPY